MCKALVMMAMLAGSGEASLVLDSEPLGSGVCELDLAAMRGAHHACRDDVGSRPTARFAFASGGVLFLLGVLTGHLMNRKSA